MGGRGGAVDALAAADGWRYFVPPYFASSVLHLDLDPSIDRSIVPPEEESPPRQKCFINILDTTQVRPLSVILPDFAVRTEETRESPGR